MSKFLSIYILIFSQWLQVNGQSHPLFQSIDAEHSGIHFNNKIVDTKEHSILIYSNYYGGAGVAVCDFNGDGLQDLYFAGNLVADKLYKNNGNLRFEDITERSGIINNHAWSSTVLTGDVNNDGLNDIYVTCELYDDQPELRVNKLYINKGEFKFTEAAETYGLADSERTRGATFIDFDKDGFLDLFVLNQPPNPGNYSRFSGKALLDQKWSPRLLKNMGGKGFVDVSKSAGITTPCYPNSTVASDLNNDGWQDLYVANDFDAPDFMLINNQDGTFTNIANDALGHMSYFSMGVDIADINNDGRQDIMTLDMVAEDNYRQKANMGGMYPEKFWKLVDNGGHYQYMFNTMQLNYGKERFGNIAQLSGISNTDWSWSNIIADFDNDGWKDIYVTNGLLRDIRNTDMSKEFPEYVQELASKYVEKYPNSTSVPILEIMDIPKALEMHPSVPLSNYVFKNNGDLTFTKSIKNWGMDYPSFSNGCAYADLDNDGDLDIVVNNINQKAFLFENKSNSNWIRFQLVNDIDNSAIQGATVAVTNASSEQFVEISNARGMYSCSESIAHFGMGSNERIETVFIKWPDNTTQKLSNIPTNQIITIKKSDATNSEAETIVKQQLYKLHSSVKFGIDFSHQENYLDDFEKQVLLPHKLSQLGPAIAVSDVNGDGLDDFYIGGAAGQLGAMFLQKSDGTFQKGHKFSQDDSIFEDIDAAFFDFENDGDLDLYVVSGGNAFPARTKNYLDRFYLNDGAGNFTRRTDLAPRILESGSCVRPFDYDGDGDIDLFLGGRHNPWNYPTPSISRILENQGQKFVDVTKEKGADLIFNGMVTDATWADYSGDGLADLIVVGEWMPITFYRNSQDGLQLDSTTTFWKNNNLAQTNGWWNHITRQDVDNDGDMDFICGNLGKNYKYKASQQEPFEVHYDDFDNSGKKDIVLSYYNMGSRFPLRGRSCSSQQIPDIAKDFPTFDLFAQASLSEIYDPLGLSQALHLEAFMFESIVLYNNGNGNFSVSDLPNQLQVSAINDLVVRSEKNELNLIVGGNRSQAEIETPKNDASVGGLLKISGQKMKFIDPELSGILLPFEIRKLENITIDGKVHILVVSNNDELRLLSQNVVSDKIN